MESIEERAKAQGWKPQDEFKGNPDDWRPAEEFLERGQKILPILQERFSKLEKDFAAQNTKLVKVTENLTKFADFHKGTYQRAYENAKRDIEARMARAEEDNDFTAYKQANDDLKQVELDMQVIEQESQDGPTKEPVPEFFDFTTANPWYDSDPAMTVYANHIAANIQPHQVSSNGEFYALIEQEVRRQFPHKFDQQTAGAVEDGSGEQTGEKKGKKNWGNLPKEAKDAYLMNFSDIPGFSKDDYARDYFAQEEGA